jgi:hypothetical protein
MGNYVDIFLSLVLTRGIGEMAIDETGLIIAFFRMKM